MTRNIAIQSVVILSYAIKVQIGLPKEPNTEASMWCFNSRDELADALTVFIDTVCVVVFNDESVGLLMMRNNTFHLLTRVCAS